MVKDRESEVSRMGDLISRQAAIDAILHITNCKSVRELFEYNQLHHLTEMWSGGVNDAIDAVIGVDSAQLGTDTISRQEAIDEILGQPPEPHYPSWYAEQIKRLPSAQPEIIRCKDCKYRMPYDWMFSETWQSQNMDDYPDDEIGCLYCDMAMKADDFCSRAERRTDE